MFSKQIRRGKVLVLQNVSDPLLSKDLKVAIFSLNPRNIYLIVKSESILHVVK
jgi:hypothetical protein